MKKRVGGIIILFTLAAGFTGAAYWSGIQAERWHQDALAEGSKNPNFKFVSVRYERGIFSSQLTARFQFPASDESKETDPSFSIRQDIYHGPIPLAGWNVPGVPMHWGGAVMRSTLDPESGTWTRELAKLYGGQEPIVAISQIGFDGASDTQITMPPLTLSNVADLQSLNFTGLQGQFQVAPKNAAVRGKMTVAGLDIVGKPTTGEDQTPRNGNQAKLNNLAMTVNQRKGAFDLMFGESSFKVGELRIQDQAAGFPVIFTHLGMDAAVSLNPQNPQQVAIEALFKADQIATDQRSGSGSLRLALRNLDGATVARLQQWQQKLAGGSPDDPQALDELLKLVKTLLAGKPEIALDTQAKLTTEGEWQGKLTLNFQDFDIAQATQNPMGLLAALEKGLADMTVTKALLEKELDKMTEGQAAPQLQGMTAAGFIRLEGDQYKSTARFEGGKLFVNDKEIPLASTADREETTSGESDTGEADAAQQSESAAGAPDQQ